MPHKFTTLRLLIAMLIVGLVSPVCAYSSGQSWAQICQADGSVSVVVFDEQGQVIDAKETQQKQAHEKHKICIMCGAPAIAPISQHFVPANTLKWQELLLSLDKPHHHVLRSRYELYTSRAPPIFL